MKDDARLTPDRALLDKFIKIVFRHADKDGRVSIRVFIVNKTTGKPKAEILDDARLDDADLLDRVVAAAAEAANDKRGLVFSPPIATFGEKAQWQNELLVGGRG
jgi:hypothetical protein